MEQVPRIRPTVMNSFICFFSIRPCSSRCSCALSLVNHTVSVRPSSLEYFLVFTVLALTHPFCAFHQVSSAVGLKQSSCDVVAAQREKLVSKV